MVKINPSVTLELENGQTITIDLEEAKQLVKSLAKLVQEGNGDSKKKTTTRNSTKQGRKGRKGGGGRKGHKKSLAGMSDAKRKSIVDHVNKRLSSSQPQTLSHLLKGMSYSPNHLPLIRQMVEDQKHVSRKVIGKRTFYLLSSAESKKAGRPSKATAAAA